MNPSTLLRADGSANFQALLEDGERVFCRVGSRANAGGSVLAVLPAAEHPTPATLDRLAHEYGLKEELDGAWAVRPLELIRDGGRTMLVLEDPGGEPLERLLGAPLETDHFLRPAIDITVALGKLHRQGLLHKDIKPANILVNCADGQVRLTGFGIASRVPRERQAPQPPETVAGTLAYMAPEQTGRMNRSIDSRSDLYALGVTFYQMLTGSLPFTAADPMEWVHCHIARKPLPPSERLENIPAPVSEIIMKLLAKTAEERYQTAAGVESDLRRCLAERERKGRIDSFALGEHDAPDRLLLPEKLYGRAGEIETLLACFDRIVHSGAAELVLVSGYSGIGKSSVVNELQRVLVEPRALFASGKFDQYKRDIPYSTLAQAFQSLIRPLLAKSDAELAGWREAFREALGPNGRLIIDLVPELKLIIGDQPPVPELPPHDAQRRFQLVFRRFLAVFARPEHPLALFLDDLQWLDSATLDLLEDLLTQPDVRHLMLIGAYRDNEVDSAHPLIRKLEAIRKAGAVVHEIILAPLAREDLGRLIGDSLHCEPERVTALTELIHEKTAGNPFFVNQLISALVEEGLLTFDYREGRWSWDLNSIRAKGYTDNVVDLMVGRLNRLPVETQHALQVLACMGNSAEFALLEMASQQSTEKMHGQLWEALRVGLIFRTEHSYTFLHDRVQQAAFSLIPEEARAAAHLRIGRLLATHIAPEEREGAIFEIVNQLNRGASLITSQEEREKLAELNLIAGKRAKASSAHASALTYLTAGTALLPEDTWERRQELAFALELHRADCELWTGAQPPAEKRLAVLATRAADTVQRSAVASRRVDLYTMLGASDRAVEVGLEFLRYVGIDWAAHPTELEARREYELFWSHLGTRKIEDLIDLPLMKDPESLATLDVLTTLGVPTLFTDQNLYTLTICRAVNLSLERGNSDAAPAHYVSVGLIAGDRFGDYDTGYRFGKIACDLTEHRGLKRLGGKTYLVFALVVPWTRPVREAIDPARLSFQMANEQGDPTFAAYACRNLVSSLFASGEPLDQVAREAENGLDFSRRVRFEFAADMISSPLALVRTLRGETAKFGSLDHSAFTERSFEERLTGRPALALPECFYWIRKLQARYFASDYASAVEAAEKAEGLFSTSTSLWTMLLERAQYHLYAALSRAACCEPMGLDSYAKHREALAAHQAQLRDWAANCPANFENCAALLSAEIARIEGRELDAERLYEQAIGSARANGFIHNEALAYELAARFYAARGFKQIADLYLRNARYGYLRWGAVGKVRQLDETYPDLRQEDSLPGPMSTIGAPLEHLDLATVIKVSQAVSGEIVLESLIETLMRTAIAQAGAERALLIMPCGQETRIEAEATTSGDTVTVRLVDEAVTEHVIPESVLHYVLRTREIVILDDAAAQSPLGVDSYIRQRQARSILCLPLLNQAKLIGVLYLENNLTPRVFAPTRISVLKLLASQAAIALENAHLYRDVAEREKQLTATSEVLRTISNAPSDVQSALDAVAEHAARLCGASNARIWRLEDNVLRLVATYGESSATMDGREGLPADRDTVTGRAACDRRTIHVHDIAAEASEYPLGSRIVKGQGWRTTLATPLLREGTPIGTILVRRMEVRPFYDQQIALLETFADQAAIAIENVRLFEAEKQRTLALASANRDLAEREAKIRRLVDSNIIGIFIWDFDGRVLEANNEFLRMVNYDREDLVSGRIRWTDLTPPDWRERDNAKIEQHKISGRLEPFEKEYTRRDGSRVPVLIGVATFEEGGNEGVAFVLDLTDRKRAEEKSRESELKLRQITETVPGLVWSNGPDGEPTHVNQRMLDYSGMPFDEFKHRGWEAFVHPADFPETAEAFYHAIQTGTSYQGVMRLRRADGEFRWHHARCEPLCDREGRIVQWYGLSIDIDERKRAEEALRESEAKFSDYAATASDWLWEIGPDYRFTLLTENAFRSDPAARIGTLCWEHALDLETEPEKWRLVRATLDSRKPFHNFVYCSADGSGSPMYVKASGKPVFDADEEFRGYRGTGTDVTAIIRAEYLTQQMFETSSDSLSIVGRDYRYQRANPAFERRWGMPAGTIAGMNVADLLGMESFEQMAKAYLDRCLAGEEVSYTDWLTTPLGRRYSAVTYSPLRPESKRVEAALVIIRDLTEHMLASEALREAQMELAHANRVATMGQLTASIAHEVNQPIGSARNNARAALNFLERRPPDLDEVREALGCIVADADRAGGIIDRIRDQIKKVPPRRERFDLNRAIEEVIGLAQSMITENGVSVQSRLASGMAPVHGDRVQLQQVVFNLILNAVEAMSSVEADERELLISTDQSEANGTLVAVHDSGPGIDPKHLELVFEPFYSTKSGMGMGLSICRSIIAAHGGRLWAAAIEPGGALFQFMLPSAEAKSSIARPFTTLESREKTFL